jgi:hypothetical protein
MHVGRMIAVKSCGGWEDFCRDVVGPQATTAECSLLLMKETLPCDTVIRTPVQSAFSHKLPASERPAHLLRNLSPALCL